MWPTLSSVMLMLRSDCAYLQPLRGRHKLISTGTSRQSCGFFMPTWQDMECRTHNSLDIYHRQELKSFFFAASSHLERTSIAGRATETGDVED
jgi:hypothetical protein